MPKVILSIDGVVIRESRLTKERTSLGRRPYNDIVIDNLAVSGEHAAFHIQGDEVTIEDLKSTNGTLVNGHKIKTHRLANGDIIDVGKYRLKYVSDETAGNFEPTTFVATTAVPLHPAEAPRAGGMAAAAPLKPAAPATANWRDMKAVIKVMAGPAAGRELQLVKVVTTLGKPGVAVASITRRAQGFMLNHVDGETRPRVNGEALEGGPVALKDGDMLDIAGISMQFNIAAD